MGWKPRWWRRAFAACAGLGFVAALWSAAEASLAAGDALLTLEEQRWCRVERLRLEGERGELDSTQGWEVERFNAANQTHNTRCAGKPYTLADDAVVDQELTPEYQEALRQEGAGRLRVARAERDGRRGYVKSVPATVRAEPSSEAAKVGAVAQWGDVFPTGETRGGWTQVEWGVTRPETEPAYAWVHGALLAPGDGAKARFDHCEAIAGEQGAHNEVVRGKASLDGGAGIEFHNGHDEDAYVKLAREDDDLVIAFLVFRGRVAEVEKIPAGSYELLYGTGHTFSRRCDSFSHRGFAERFVEPVEFGEGGGWTFWVEAAGDGTTAKAELIDYALFESR